MKISLIDKAQISVVGFAAIILLMLALSGCADKEIVYTPVTVEKPVAVKCEVPQIAPPMFPSPAVSDSLYNKVKILIAENTMRKGYEVKLVAANKACE